MLNTVLYNITPYFYLLCTLLYLVYGLFKSERIGKAATILTFAGLLVNVAGFIARWIESYQVGLGHLPIRGPYECLTFSACMLVFFYLAIELKIKIKIFGIFIMPVAFLLMVYATIGTRITKQILPMPKYFKVTI